MSQPEAPDKYRLKARQLVTDWRVQDSRKGPKPWAILQQSQLNQLEDAIADALVESAREAYERAAQTAIVVAKGWSADRVGFSIAEAIRKKITQ